MHFALLFGYGASIINPYMSFAAIDKLVTDKKIQMDFDRSEWNYIHAINKGLLKILSKMGISTLRSYRAAQIFEAIGLLILFLVIRAISNYRKKGKTSYERNVTIPSLLPFQEGSFSLYEEEGNLFLKLKPMVGTVEELFDEE